MIPRATYRVQFHKGFPFRDALPLVDYWARLGISHVYASPIATARTGSGHGYDVIDPARINPELGGEKGFRALASALKAQGIGLVLDIVPNHVAVGQGDNGWWLDVLEHGEASRFAGYFDIDWHPADPALDGKLLAPFLGTRYADALAGGDLRLEPWHDRLAVVAYGAHVFPLRPEDQAILLAEAGGAIDAALLDRYNAPTLEAHARLHALCERQHWRLAWWRSAGDAINWRRFFDITELAGLRIEDETVFDAVHALPLRLYAEGLIDGVRVDHVDGLADPGDYGRRLRAALEEAGARRPAEASPGPAYIVVEKILAQGEQLPPDWPIDGTSGYDFLNDVSALLHDPAGAEPLGALWHTISGRPAAFAPEEHDARRMMVARGFVGQIDATADAFGRLARSDLATRDIAVPALRRAIGWLLESFPAYRTYGTGDAAPPGDAAIRGRAVVDACLLAGPAEEALVRRIGDWLAGDGTGDPALRRDAVRRFQQLSAPIAAKSVEDTAFYRYGRLLSRNDVGCDPARLGSTAEAFATTVLERHRLHPHAMLATATHDHKRGEDVRMRLAVLSEVPDLWADRARRWAEDIPADVAPGDAYMLHQMIVGAWPDGLSPADGDALAAYRERLAGWQLKALREAKLRSSWAAPGEAYEQACRDYLAHLLAPGSPFADDASRFVAEIAPAGFAKSLVQVGLRYTLPGVPDIYQGTEDWDLSLVDPDNRRPVDYARLRSLIEAGGAHPKLELIVELLDLRRRHAALFAEGDIRFLPLAGARAGEAIAFERRLGGERLRVVAAIRCARACIGRGAAQPSIDWWADTAIADDDGPAARDIAGDGAFGFQLFR